jgi:hypothetical protein
MRKAMRFFFAGFFLLLGFLFALPGMAQTPPPEPNAGTHVQISGNYTLTGGQGQAAVVLIGVPVTNRFSILAVNAVAPKAGLDGLTFHSLELEYARNLADIIKTTSAQVNPSRFYFAVSGGAGAVRRAQGEGNASFAFSAAGRFTLKLNDNTSLDLLNVRYWRSRIATLTGQSGGATELASGFRFSF